MMPKKRPPTCGDKRRNWRGFGGDQGHGGTPGSPVCSRSPERAIAVSEARKLGIPVVAIVDTNCDPDDYYVIPGNDDAIRAVKLMFPDCRCSP